MTDPGCHLEWQYDIVRVRNDGNTVREVIRDIFHALGRYDEHTRPDRDDYVTINWDEVSSGMYSTCIISTYIYV